MTCQATVQVGAGSKSIESVVEPNTKQGSGAYSTSLRSKNRTGIRTEIEVVSGIKFGTKAYTGIEVRFEGGSVIVVCSALIVWLTKWKYRFYIDPALSIVLVILILHSVWPLLRESALILLQTVPTHIQVDAIQRRLLEKVDGVLAVHEFHVWQLAGDRIIASAHIRCRNLSEYMKIAEKVKEFFHNEGIHSTTIQPEFVELPIDGVE
ncbi:Zinc transporter 1, partial [Eumeta japonica]